MSQARTLLASAAVIALTMGITSRADQPTDVDRPLPPGSFLVATDDTAAVGQPEESAQDSAKMGKEEGTHEGAELGDVPDSDTKMIDQPERNPTTGELSGEKSGSGG